MQLECSDGEELITHSPYFTYEKNQAQRLSDTTKIKVNQWQNWEWNSGLQNNSNSTSLLGQFRADLDNLQSSWDNLLSTQIGFRFLCSSPLLGEDG